MRWLKGKREVVAPISAPMLHMVAIPTRHDTTITRERINTKKVSGIPVHEIDSVPGPWYSTMAPVPPATVRISATFKMTSLGAVQPLIFPVRRTPIT